MKHATGVAVDAGVFGGALRHFPDHLVEQVLVGEGGERTEPSQPDLRVGRPRHDARFDERGWPYYIREVYDGFYPGYGDSPGAPSAEALTRAARQVARETGARYGGVLYVDSLSAAGGPVPTYLDLLKVTVETIAKGFGRGMR